MLKKLFPYLTNKNICYVLSRYIDNCEKYKFVFSVDVDKEKVIVILDNDAKITLDVEVLINDLIAYVDFKYCCKIEKEGTFVRGSDLSPFREIVYTHEYAVRYCGEIKPIFKTIGNDEEELKVECLIEVFKRFGNTE